MNSNRITRQLALAAAAVAMLAPAATAHAQAVPGAIDASFGSCGQATPLFPAYTSFSGTVPATEAHAVAQLQDGSILAAGTFNRAFAVEKLRPNGALDPDFGDGGRALVPFSGDLNFEATARSMAIDKDGKIVLGGFVTDRRETATRRFALVRLNGNGSLDAGFGDGGIALGEPNRSAEINSVDVAPTGEILVAGTREDRFVVSRYDMNGRLDTSFGAGGTITATFGPLTQGSASAVAVRPDGRITAAGHASTPDARGKSSFVVARWTADGTPDAAFGSAGTIVEDFDDSSRAFAMAYQQDGKLVVTGAATDEIPGSEDFTTRVALVRYTNEGRRDAAFGTDGVVLDSLGGGLETRVWAESIALQPDGRIIVGTPYSFSGIARYDSDGRRDASFGLNGVVIVFRGVSPNALLVRDGYLVAAGTNARMTVAPSGASFGLPVQRMAVSGEALDVAAQQPVACELRVATKSLRQLLRRGRTAKYGKLRVTYFLTRPGPATATATVKVGNRRVTLGTARAGNDRYAGSNAAEIKVSRSAYSVLRRARRAFIRVTIRADEAETAGGSRTLAR